MTPSGTTAGADGDGEPADRIGRRATDAHIGHLAHLGERLAAAAGHWQAIFVLALLLWGAGSGIATTVATWIGYRTGTGPGKQLAEVQAAQVRSDSIRADGFRQLAERMDRQDGRMSRLERMQTQMTLGQCVEKRRAEPDPWNACNRELRELLSQLNQ